jgi:methyltransferase-like protein/SAM-dependent methyltransferase
MTAVERTATVHFSYDAVPYPSYSYSESHPDHLATLATLFGMQPAPVERCRMLELGCASGGNLIPMAFGLPESEFVGIDLAASQIAEGKASVKELGLKNLSLHHLDILDADDSLGQFDYIVAHGIYSWVSQPVQDKLLEVCQHSLAPDGVAYVSYNVYPGWHMIDMVRGMMLYHTRGMTDPQVRAAQARALLDFLAESVPAENNAYGSYLKLYADFLSGAKEGTRPKDDALLLHDELETINEPLYFYQFIERAARHGLQYLAEAQFRKMFSSNFPREVSEALGKMSNSLVDLEQYMDFLRNRTFRQTLLCHQEVVLSRRLEPTVFTKLYVASRAQPETPNPDIHSVSVVKFRGSDGAILSTDHPVTKAAMLCLAEAWPRAVPFNTLLPAARARLNKEIAPVEKRDAAAQPEAEDVDAQVMGANLLKAYSYSETLVELHVYAPPMEVQASERPTVSPVARLQAHSSDRITNLYHQRVELDGLDRFLVRHLDGSHDRAALLELLLSGPVAQGVLTARKDGKPIEEAEEVKRLLEEELEVKFHGLAHAALFVA